MAEHVELAAAYLSIIPSLRGGGSQLRDQITGSIGVGVGAGIGLKIADGIGSVINVAKDIIRTGIDEAKDASGGIAQLQAGIKSTGGAAGKTVAEMVGLAGSIQNYSGQTDDSIVKTEALLLTFTNIKNSGPDKIFDRATKAAADMAAKFGGDASSQAVLLGKALNDPVKGITALTRVGVSFTQGQKDQIGAMVAAGDTMGAQKLILGELNTEFGGAAKAAGDSLPGQLARGQRAFEDLSQSVVETFLPALAPIAEKLPAMFEMVAPIVQGVATAVMKAFTGIYNASVPVVAFLQKHQTVAKILGIVLGVLAAALVVVAIAIWAMNTALFASPITWVIIGIAALIVAILFLVANWDTVVAFITQIWGGFCNWLMDIVNAVAGWWNGVWGAVMQFFTDVWNNIVNFVRISILAFQIIIQTGMQIAQDVVSNVLNAIGSFFSFMFNFYLGIVRGVLGFIGTAISVGMNLASSIVSTVLNAIGGFFTNMFNAYLATVSSVLGFIASTVTNGLGLAQSAASAALGFIAGVFTNAWDGITNGVSTAIGTIVTFFSGIGSQILGAIGDIGGLLYGIGGSIIQSLYDGLLSTWGNVTDFVGGIASWIAANKGPESLDRVLLRPAGRWIMGGLGESLEGEIPNLEASLNKVTATVANHDLGTASVRMFDAVKPDRMSSIGEQLVAAGAGSQGPQVIYKGDVYGFDPEEAPRKWERDLADASAVAGLRNEGKAL